jgi:hypothetical protein
MQISIVLSEETVKKMDEKKKVVNLSRNQLIEYLLKDWFKKGCKIVMEDKE